MQSDVAWQFLAEALALSILGGAAGIGLGVLLLWPHLLRWPVTIPLAAVVLALGAASVVGILSGLYPARCASRLDVTDALRFE